MSNLFPTPSWQTAQVNTYFASQNPHSGFNRGGRGYPDVSLLATNYMVVFNKIVEGGTYGASASTPVSI